MQASIHGQGYQCPNCEDIYDDHVAKVEIGVEGVDNLTGDFYRSAKSAEFWVCRDGCTITKTEFGSGHFPPKLSDIWECGECESWYLDKQEAVDCCV